MEKQERDRLIAEAVETVQVMFGALERVIRGAPGYAEAGAYRIDWKRSRSSGRLPR